VQLRILESVAGNIFLKKKKKKDLKKIGLARPWGLATSVLSSAFGAAGTESFDCLEQIANHKNWNFFCQGATRGDVGNSQKQRQERYTSPFK
jgi:hypothetical protein